ncbi:hypothetical protein DLJ53_17935 [Acuticoccus sediminis]|uniref:Uncharacterized protein n=1 Tax=Acuticoccus sediminis TaxID=2184697 RepID=A0A8B2NN61_9HYPH|nr:hypothetical protein [Acuticoccus sediminis]RAI01097.1 hypothetical protein DLJ53_17935 [Acuticoccus sediminis]
MKIEGIEIEPEGRYYVTVSQRVQVPSSGMVLHPLPGRGYGIKGSAVEEIGADVIATIRVDAIP